MPHRIHCHRGRIALIALARHIRPVALAALAGTSSYAADTTAPTNYDPAFVQQILKRLDAQEAEIKALKEQLGKQDSAIEKISDADAAKKETFPRLTFHGFGDVDFLMSNVSKGKNTFALGELDFFIDSRLSDSLRLINEDTVGADSTTQDFGFEIERLFLQWDQSDYLTLSAGRYHTSIGYYNTAYHHGTWFQTATGRPSFLAFEDSGGLIPAHNVGLQATGQIPSGKWGLRYIVEVGNGRPFWENAPGGRAPVLNLGDNNLYKAVNVAFTINPEWLNGWQFGAGIYHDTLSPEGALSVVPRTDEILAHAHAVYKASRWEFLSEGEFWRHKTRGEDPHLSQAFFGQLGYKIGLFTPYARFTYQNASNLDPVWQAIAENGLRYGPSGGIRWDFTQFAALKLQYDYWFRQNDSDLQQLTLQAAFTF